MNRLRQATADVFMYGEQVTAAVSGGADSMVMLDCLLHCGRNLNVRVVHLNHSLRGVESDKDYMFVKDYCKANGLPFYYRKEDVNKIAKEKKVSQETAGRLLRYAFFEEFSGRVSLAHTLSDRVETMLFNMARGSALSGLASIPKERGKYIRPLIDFTKEQVYEYADRFKIKYREDTTNQDTIYRRNYIRHEIIPLFERINPKFEAGLKDMMDSIRQDDEYLYLLADEQLKGYRSEEGIETAQLNALPFPIKSRVIMRIVQENAIEPDRESLMRILDLADRQKGRTSLKNNKSAAIRQHRLFIDNCSKSEDFSFNLTGDFNRVKGYDFIVVKNQHINEIYKNYNARFIFILNYDIIKFPVTVRTRRAGDKIKLPLRPTKTLKKLFQENAMSKEKRDNAVVLADEEGVLWVSGFGADVRALASGGDKNFLIVKETV